MYRVLLIDQDPDHAERLASRLRQHGLTDVIAASIPEAARRLQHRIPVCDLVLVAAAEISDQWLDTLRTLIDSSRQSLLSLGPLFLFTTRQECSPRLRLRIEHLGARYARG